MWTLEYWTHDTDTSEVRDQPTISLLWDLLRNIHGTLTQGGHHLSPRNSTLGILCRAPDLSHLSPVPWERGKAVCRKKGKKQKPKRGSDMRSRGPRGETKRCLKGSWRLSHSCFTSLPLGREHSLPASFPVLLPCWWGDVIILGKYKHTHWQYKDRM